MTDAEIDHLLERFDRTEPALQRKITARLMQEWTILRTACEVAVKTLDDPLTLASQRLTSLDLLRRALAMTETEGGT